MNERTPIMSAPGRQDRNVRRFQCWICAGLFSAFLIALIVAVSYAVLEEKSEFDFDNTTVYSTDVELLPNGSLPGVFFINFPLQDEIEVNWTLPIPTEAEIESALNEGKRALGDKEMLEEIIIAPVLNSPTYRHQRAVSTSPKARTESKRGFVEDKATIFLAKMFDHNTRKIGRSNIGKGPKTKMNLKHELKCAKQMNYRFYNGTCNNLRHPLWGSAMIPFRRALNSDYCDGISMPRCSVDSTELPSARQISITVHRPSYYTDPHFTVMLAVFGQFLDHDITATALNQGINGQPIECCNTGLPMHPECFPVPLAAGDPYFDQYNNTCMNFVRSVPAPTNHFGPREQLNQASAYIDGSVVYGSTLEKITSLRTLTDGKLKMFLTPDNRTLLPVNKNPKDGCNEAKENAKGQYCFTSGDERANENLHLTSMHLIWARHHNSIVDSLNSINPHWDDERLFQEARRILGAQLQHITYNEFLSVVLGKDSSEKFGLLSHPGGSEDTYDENVDASIANNFAAAAFRFAHTLLPGLMKITKDLNNSEESIALHNMLFNPYSLYTTKGLDVALKSAMNTMLEKSDPYFTKELTEKLFARATPCGLDLVSLNIQRARDHGLPAYGEWRKHCRLPAVDSWEMLAKAVDPESLKKMKEIYKTPENIDVYTGGLSEPPVKGGILGPLFTCLIGDQFLRLKRGDSYWYERSKGVHIFTRDQLSQIFDTTLSSVICKNSDSVEYSQQYVMKRVTNTNPLVKCVDMDTFNFEPWREKEMVLIKINSEESKVHVQDNRQKQEAEKV